MPRHIPKLVIARSEATKQSSGALRTSFVVQRNRATELDCFAALAMTKERKKQIKEAERRQTRDPTVRILRCGARPLSLLLPQRAGRLGGGALACRRSTTALAAATERYSSAPDTRFLGLGRGARSQRFEQPGSKDRALFSGRYPLLPVPVQRASRRPVIVPAGRIFPEPPGSGGDEPRPREPLSLRQPASPAGVLYVSEIVLQV